MPLHWVVFTVFPPGRTAHIRMSCLGEVGQVRKLGEARKALAKAVFFNRLGEVRGRSYEDPRHRASGLNLLVAAIVLRNTVYIEW